MSDARSPDLNDAIATADPHLQRHIDALDKEILRLQKQIAKLEAANVSADSRIKALAGELEDRAKTENMSDAELEDLLIPVAIKHVKAAGGWEQFCQKHGVSSDPAG
ncbi:MAG: hypothetical protein NXI04_22720 [Planctomycetaceae bacterium]|nr:hypothetical protein [Planctomycetaceae bacterium]